MNFLSAVLSITLVGSSVILSPFKHEAVSVPAKAGWTVGHKYVRNGMFILQLLPPGGDPTKSTTYINVVTYSGLKEAAKKFADSQQKNAPKLKGKAEFKYTDEKNPSDVTYELSLSGNKELPDQFEVHRVVTGKDGLHDISYHVEPATQTQQTIAEMHELLNAVKLVAPPAQADKPYINAK